MSIGKYLKKYLIAGLLVWLPIAVTIWLIGYIINATDWLANLVPQKWQPENAYRPFCSERCKLIDLGAWADEQHALPALPETPEEWDALHHD